MIKPIKKLTGLKMEHAQTMVEFALVFPIVLLITYGLIEFGRMVFIYAAVTGSAREGTRYGAAVGGTTPQYADCAGIRNAVRSTAFLITIPDNRIVIRYDSGPGTATKTNCPPPLVITDPSHIILGDRIVVQVNACYQPIISFLNIGKMDCSNPANHNITAYNARTILKQVPITYP